VIGDDLETPIKIRMLQRKLYKRRRNSRATVSICLRQDVPEDVLAMPTHWLKSNQGAPGVDGQSFRGIESRGLEEWAERHQGRPSREDVSTTSRAAVMIRSPAAAERPPVSTYGIGWCDSAKLLLEPIFEADFDPNAYGYRPKRSAQEANPEVHKLLCAGYDDVVDADLSKYLDTASYCPLVHEIAR